MENEVAPVGSKLTAGEFIGSLVIDQGVRIVWMDGKGQRRTAWLGTQELAALRIEASRPEHDHLERAE